MEKKVDKNTVLLVATLSSFLTPFMGSSVVVAIPTIGKHFGMNAVLLDWIVTSYILAAGMFLVPFGRLADIYGRRRIFTYGIILDTIACVTLAFSMSEKMFLAFRAVQGLGGAMIFGTGLAMLTSAFGPGERGRALGINIGAVYLGLSLGPIIGGFLVQTLGWRSIFLANLPMVAVVLFLIFTRLKTEWIEARGERFDWAGSLLYMASLVLFMLGLSLLPARMGIIMLAGAAAGLTAFWVCESKAESPVLHVNLFRGNAVFTFSNLAALANYSATFAVGFLMSLYLQDVQGLTPRQVGFVLLCQPVVQAIFSPLAGRLSDRMEPRVLASAGMGFTVAGLVMLAAVGKGTHLGFVVAALVVLGFSFALFSSPNTNAIMSAVDRKFYGVASAMVGTMRLMGQMVSMGIATLVFALYIGPVQITPARLGQLVASLRTAFIIFAILCGLGIFASLARGKMRTDTATGGRQEGPG